MPVEKRTVAILIFEDVELLDFAGPYEVFSSVRKPGSDTERLLEVFTVAEVSELVTCRNGLVVKPDHTLDSCPAFDLMVVPGGRGTRTAVRRPALIDWIAERSETTELTTSVCTGSFLLAEAGLLTGKATTTHWGSIEQLRQRYPEVEVKENIRWVEAGNIISSAGVSAGIDMALFITAKLYGSEVASETARGMEYDYWS
ncbi:MAG: DJ-1/PfpI family protein [Trueperaceae bacterium]|nr:MAG: DJ-1/PfpI family protein [Trueperaceae bacterium]